MPERKTLERARRDRREGKAPSTQAGEFVREEIHHIREGKHGARSAKQAIAIGLSKSTPGWCEIAATTERHNLGKDSQGRCKCLQARADRQTPKDFSEEESCHVARLASPGPQRSIALGALASGADNGPARKPFAVSTIKSPRIAATPRYVKGKDPSCCSFRAALHLCKRHGQ